MANPSQSVPQWKKELILRRRAHTRAAPTATGSVTSVDSSPLTCRVRSPEFRSSADFHLRQSSADRGVGGARRNMRLTEQVDVNGEFVVPEIRELMTKIEVDGVKNSKMGEDKGQRRGAAGDGPQEENLSDEELKYGPGIVSRLKNRYLSLTLRENQGKIRPSLANMRKAASLENILDEPEKEDQKPKYIKNVQPAVNGSPSLRCRSISRGNKDSMKRARSVEVLSRYEKASNALGGTRRSFEVYEKVEELEAELKRPGWLRTSSSFEEKEMPPPDVVKQTLKLFESSTGSTKLTSPSLIKTCSVPKGLGQIESSAKKPTILPKPTLSNDRIKHRGASMEKLAGREVLLIEKCSPRHESDVARSTCIRGSPESKQYDTEKEETRQTASSKERGQPDTVISRTGDEGDGDFRLRTEELRPRTGMSLDLIETTQHHTHESPAKPANDSPDLLLTSPSRSLSPVLVRAPPSILSAEITSNHSPTQPKQIGVIRPMVTNKHTTTSPKYNLNKPLSPSGKEVEKIKPRSLTDREIEKNLNKPHSPTGKEEKHRPRSLTDREIEKSLNKPQSPTGKEEKNKPRSLTDREIEKNLINKVRSVEQPVTKVIVSLKKSPEECTVGPVRQEDGVKTGVVWEKKPNTVVFNFSDRKSVPDYIENDGLILSSKKDNKSKQGEPGFIVLGGGTEDCSTDFDPEDFNYESTSPSSYTFVGDNVVINGKSSMKKKKSTRKKVNVQFNDDATSVFEYPSETSLTDGWMDTSNAASPGFSSLPSRGGGNLASYTPSKVSIATDFQLGVTRTVSPVTSLPPQHSDPGPSEQEECLRPADDNDTVTWSSEKADDLLF